MRLGRRSSNIQDRRGMGRGTLIAGGGIGTIVIVVLALLFGADPAEVLQSGGGEQPAAQVDPNDPQAVFVSQVLADTEDTWNTILPQQAGQDYKEPQLVLFSGLVQSACGTAQSASGPFYCPLDQKVYIDLSFYDDLKNRLGAPGDFAQAYVIAHEVGHHIQTLLGISEQVHSARQRAGQGEANQLSVRQELQADCLAGVWAHHGQRQRQILEAGDVEEGLNAASAIGDDRLQRRSQGQVVPESFTHGTSAQRVRWFRRGMESGRMQDCDTFGQAAL
ncbi:MAG TPA: neutral zinc metallopeptidase [Thermoanaerobaculia bacterium]|nr:neutral zinc metallopeptidase [Thermoanaerobaculia bacterium]